MSRDFLHFISHYKPLLVNIKFPTEIGLYGLANNLCHMAAYQCHMVLETVLADILHQLLEVVHLGHGNATIHSVRLIGDIAFAKIGFDTTTRIVGGNTEEGEVAL